MKGFIYNITFVTSADRECAVMDYLVSVVMPHVFPHDASVKFDGIRKVVEAGGEKVSDGDGVSIALSAFIDTLNQAHTWHDEILIPALDDFNQAFGDNALFFITLLENLR